MTKKKNTESASTTAVNKIRAVVAIDPGTKHLGFAHFANGHLVDCGVRTIAQGELLNDVFSNIDAVVSRLIDEKTPDVLVLENNHFSQISYNFRLSIAIARIKKIGDKYNARVVEIHPRSVRKLICGNGNASKRELARTITALIPSLRPYLESNRKWREQYYFNMFDAVGCGLAYLRNTRHQVVADAT